MCLAIRLGRGEGFAQTGCFIPVRDGMGAGGGWKILPSPYNGGDREKCVFCRLAFFSPLGLRTEIWTRYYLEMTRNCVTRLFVF